MKLSEYKSYDDLPLFLNAAMVAKVLGVSPSSGYELIHEKDFPVLKVGTTGDMQKRAADIVGGFLTDYLGEEMKPWQNAENGATAE